MLNHNFIRTLPVNTGPDGMPFDPKGDPDLQRALSIQFALALHGRVFATLNENELKRFEFYREQGLEFGIVATIEKPTGPADNDVMGSASNTVSVVRLSDREQA